MRISVVNVLNKKGHRKIGNYRSASLVYTDYKILAKIMIEKLKTTLSQVTGTMQQFFIEGRDATENISLVKEEIEH